MTEPWLLDCQPSTRYPLYTRANVGEVFPEPVTPLSWTLDGWMVEEGWRDALVEFGAFDRSEFRPGGFEVLGVFGGHIYLNVSGLSDPRYPHAGADPGDGGLRLLR